MKCNKFYKTIWALSAILTGFSIVLFAHGLLLLAPQIASTVNVVNASSLSVTCAVSTSTPITGGTVTWLASASGGTGSYTFSWSGTDALTGTSGSVSKVYTTAGVKTASVSASFGGSSASCSSSIIVTSAPAPACSDGVDNDGDGSIDFPADIGCASGSDTDESNIPLSASCSVAPTAGSTGSAFTWTVVPAGGVTGIYTFTWSGTDGLFGSATTTTKSYLTAGTKTGSVTVTADTETIALSCANSAVVSGPTIPPQCSDGIDNDGDGSIDFPADLGCSSALDNDETNIPAPIPTPPPTLTPTSAPLSSSGGGGGGGPRIRLQINNEKVVKLATSTALVTWDTNLQAQSKVFYGKDSHASSSLPFIEYTSSTEKGISSVTKHSMTITGLDNDATYYFRPAAFRSDEEKGGIELMLTPDSPSTPVTPAMCSKYLLKPIKFGEESIYLKLQNFKYSSMILKDIVLMLQGFIILKHLQLLKSSKRSMLTIFLHRGVLREVLGMCT